MRSLFSLTLFISAFLLFLIQLIIAKMLLPLLGGSASVWQICQFLFQGILLLGYSYAYLISAQIKQKVQIIIHGLLIFLPLVFLPINLTGKIPDTSHPIIWLLTTLLITISLPFFVISTSSPLLQYWFSNTDHPHSNDPYFLYAASNLGSMLGVIGYPIFIEPNFTLSQQSLLYTYGYGFLIFLILLCGIFSLNKSSEDNFNMGRVNGRSPLHNIIYVYQDFKKILFRKSPLNPPLESPLNPPLIRGVGGINWVFLGFIPSSLMLGITNYITTDLASLPLLWCLPLSLYLLSFIITFAQKKWLNHHKLKTFLPLLLAPIIILAILKINEPVWLLLPLHLIIFFITSCVIHGELSDKRPDKNYLTNFYLWISLGGVLGGLFNAIAAPLLFPSLLEYPLMMGLTMLILKLPQPEKTTKTKQELLAEVLKTKDLAQIDKIIKTPIKENIAEPKLSLKFTLPISIGLLLCVLLVGFQINSFANHWLEMITSLIILIIFKYAFNLNKIRLVTGIILISMITVFYLPNMGVILHTERSFYGVNRVLFDKKGNYNILLHGTTIHGKQSLDINREKQPLTYFYPTGGIGQLFTQFNHKHKSGNIAVMGLGIGSLAAYSRPEQNWTFYEIDKVVEKIAKDERYFTFLKKALGQISVILGDGRLKIAEVKEHYYDLIIMDAFSSDAIPVHLISKEAIELYLNKLTKTGIIAINISNRYINLEPVLNTVAKKLELYILAQKEINISPAEKALGKTASHWVILTNKKENLGELVKEEKWQTIPDHVQTKLWTDDYSNILNVMKFKELKL